MFMGVKNLLIQAYKLCEIKFLDQDQHLNLEVMSNWSLI